MDPEREQTQLWRDTHDRVLSLLNEFDPYGLQPGNPDGAPQDEYEPEAKDISRQLLAKGAITLEELDGIWVRWFGESFTECAGAAAAADFLERL